MDIFIKAVIRKDQITSIGGLKGCKASGSVAIDGTTCQSGDIVFLGFRGRLSRVTGLYEKYRVSPFYLWLGFLGVVLLLGAYATAIRFLGHEEVFGATNLVPLGILISTYIFFQKKYLNFFKRCRNTLVCILENFPMKYY